MEYVRTADDAVQLSDLLRSGTDGRAVVLASVARATGRAYVDEVRLERALAETVDVYVVSPEAGRVLRRNVPATRHVFGGAAQAYAPVRGGRPVVSGPLRVAFGVADVDRMTNELIRDVTTLVAGRAPRLGQTERSPSRSPVADFNDDLETGLAAELADEVDD